MTYAGTRIPYDDDIAYKPQKPYTLRYNIHASVWAHTCKALWLLNIHRLQPFFFCNILTCICLRWRLFRDLGNLAHRTVISWRHTGDNDRCVGAGSEMGGEIRKIKAIRWGAYWHVYAHVWARVAGWVGEEKNTRIVVMRIGYIF
jgi:hypothetical protein